MPNYPPKDFQEIFPEATSAGLILIYFFPSVDLETLCIHHWTKLCIHLCTKNKFSIKDFFSKCDQIGSFLKIRSHLLKKSLMENFIFCAVHVTISQNTPQDITVGF